MTCAMWNDGDRQSSSCACAKLHMRQELVPGKSGRRHACDSKAGKDIDIARMHTTSTASATDWHPYHGGI